jgi:cell fate regulator YaaT (PSP1 superfamily)
MNNSCLSRGCPGINSETAEVKPCTNGCCNKLDVSNWLSDVPASMAASDIVEVRFKNTRKAFYRNVNELVLKVGDIVAVEASPGHDIGVVSLAGELVNEQLRRYQLNPNENEFRKVYRKAKPADIEKWMEAINLEEKTMLKARAIASRLGLNMKIGDVEYQGDRTKAIFYYIADERVDFRELIKVLAEEFRVRIEMRQIGARQEAGRIGGIASCGRELCCSTWITNFVSVTTSAARYQEVSLNPQKLAGQCGKLKCCLNFELDVYLDAQKEMPEPQPLETAEGTAYQVKTDVFRRIMWYSFDKDAALNMTAVSVERVYEIMDMNKRGLKAKVLSSGEGEAIARPDFENVVGQDSVTRFQEKKKKKKPRSSQLANSNNNTSLQQSQNENVDNGGGNKNNNGNVNRNERNNSRERGNNNRNRNNNRVPRNPNSNPNRTSEQNSNPNSNKS